MTIECPLCLTEIHYALGTLEGVGGERWNACESCKIRAVPRLSRGVYAKKEPGIATCLRCDTRMPSDKASEHKCSAPKEPQTATERFGQQLAGIAGVIREADMMRREESERRDKALAAKDARIRELEQEVQAMRGCTVMSDSVAIKCMQVKLDGAEERAKMCLKAKDEWTDKARALEAERDALNLLVKEMRETIWECNKQTTILSRMTEHTP